MLLQNKMHLDSNINQKAKGKIIHDQKKKIKKLKGMEKKELMNEMKMRQKMKMIIWIQIKNNMKIKMRMNMKIIMK